MSVIIPIWPGSSSYTTGSSPFGFYDTDTQYIVEIDSAAEWAAKRLGYPLSQIELQDVNFFACFEEAITEYGNQVNTYAARDNLINLLGYSTGSNINLSGKYITPNLKGVIRLSKAYGSEVGAGGLLTYFTGSITMTANKQIYDFKTDAVIESGSFSTDQFTIRKIYHESPPALTRFIDPTLGTGLSTVEFMNQFGFGGYSVPGNYLMQPIWADLLRIQAIEFNDQIRKSGYSFQLTNNRLRIFPIPQETFKLWFLYTLDNENSPIDSNGILDPDSVGKITDYSNIPYQNIVYRHINGPGKQWIRKYFLALCKETLGWVRSKYATMPIPDGEVTLNGPELLEAGKSDREALITELKEMLDMMSRQSQLERKSSEAESLNNQLKWIPTRIYIR